MKNIEDFTIQELVQELNRRYAMETKRVFDRRTALTKFIRENSEFFKQFADCLGNENLKRSIEKVCEYTYNCVDVTFIIENGKDFMDAIFKEGNTPVWAKYLPNKEQDPVIVTNNESNNG